MCGGVARASLLSPSTGRLLRSIFEAREGGLTLGRSLLGLVLLQNLYLANKLFGVLVSTNIVVFVST